MAYSIEVYQLRKTYGEQEVLKGISFQVKEKEIFAFLGPNGAGKSTAIAILTTLITFDSGKVLVEGYDLKKDQQKICNRIGVVFQESMLDKLLTVNENLLLRCGLYQIYGAQAKKRVNEMVNVCQLQEFMNQKVKNLSGGQRRRADIARALLANPKLLILDEPSTGLDPYSRKALWKTIQHIHKEKGMSIFLTTHYLEESEIADHIVMINKGKIILDAYKEDLLKLYNHEEVYLYTNAKDRVKENLKRRHVSYVEQKGAIVIKIHSVQELMLILQINERYLQRIELHKGSMEEVYLKLLEGDCTWELF